MRFIVSHSGKQHAYRHAAAVQRCGRLARFITSTYYRPGRLPDAWLKRWARADRYLRRRYLEGLDERVLRQPLFELPELACRAVAGNGRCAERLTWVRDALFDRWVAATRLPAEPAQGFWGFQGSCCESLLAARRRGMLAVAEFATGHVLAAERILGQQRQRHPEWADSLSNAGFPAWYRRRLQAEPHRADVCVVASTFSRRTFEEAGVPPERIRLLPLGADVSAASPGPRPRGGPFRILFVGSVGQRKGIKYLLDAYDRIRSPGTRLVIVGPIVGSGRAFAAYRSRVEYLGRLDAAGVAREMARSHVLVLPSLFEGFGLVLVEAMAAGLPVIGSTHSAAPDLIEDGVHGYVLAPDDVEGLCDRLTRLLDRPELAGRMGWAAAERARDFSWERHAQRVAELLDALEDSCRQTGRWSASSSRRATACRTCA